MRSHPFTAAKRNVETKDHVVQPARHDHDSCTDSLSHSSLIEATNTRRYFTEVIKRNQIDRSVQLTQIFRLNQEVIAIAKTIITKSTQRDVAANV